MRRIKVLFFWIFCKKNNVSFYELIQFLTKPKVNVIAKRFIKKITKEREVFEVDFYSINSRLFWPKEFPISRLNQVTAETFDTLDWHYYQKQHTIIEKGEYLLDIGTAEGLFPLKEIDKCDHIYMIEPGKNFYNCLKKTFAPHLDKVTILNKAVGNFDGKINFHENFLEGKVIMDSNSTTDEVEINKIDTLFENNKKITYIKADIEGFEQEMLKGAEMTIKRNKPKIAITTYHAQNNPTEIVDIIKGYVPEYNFYVKGIDEKAPKPVLIHFWI